MDTEAQKELANTHSTQVDVVLTKSIKTTKDCKVINTSDQ